jgi:aryl-alcohol dehydrogenase-like predicted oxidoreductase
MRYRRLGGTGLDVSVIGLGTWQLGGEWGQDFTQSEVDRLIGRAGELGVNLVDTAECYGDHTSESLVGHAIKAHRDAWVVATKFGHHFHPDRTGGDPGSVRSDHWTPAEVVAQLEASLRALGTDHVDIYQAHGGTDDQVGTTGLWEALRAQVDAGKIRHLGLSVDPGDDDRVTQATSLDAEVVQVTYNRLNQVAADRLLPIAQGQRLGVIAREPLANGLLSGKYRPGRPMAGPGDWRSTQDPAALDAKLVRVQKIETDELPPGIPLARWALAWALQHPAISTVVAGSRSLGQLEGNLSPSTLDLVSPGHPLSAF